MPPLASPVGFESVAYSRVELMSNFVGWLNLGDPQRSAVIAKPVHSAMKPLAVDGLTSREMDSVTMMHAHFFTVPEAVEEHQPIISADNTMMMVSSARLDNLDELRRALPPGLPSHTDAHALLSGYQAWGTDVVHRIRGDFAFLIWDDLRRRLFGARDHLGVRPLYVAPLGNGFVAGTSLAAIIAHPDVSRDPDTEHLWELIVSEIADTERSPYRAIRRIDAGQTFTVSVPSLRMTVQNYWTPRPAPHLKVATRDDEAETRRIIDEAVIARTRAIGLVACELSGGLDSSMITGIAALAAAPDRLPVGVTFSLPGSPLDETSFARPVADKFGLELVVVDVRPQGDADADSLALTKVLGAPLQTARSQADLDLAAWASSSGCRVLLSGHGGDEVFDECLPHLLQGLRHPRRDALAELAKRRYGTVSWRRAMARDLIVPTIPEIIAGPLRRTRQRLLPGRNQYEDSLVTVPHRRYVPLRHAAEHEWREAWLSGWWQLYLDQSHIISTQTHLEARHPLIDVRLAEHVSGLWFPQSSATGHYREAQRRMSLDLLPPAVANRHAKDDYTGPLLMRSAQWNRELANVDRLASLGLVRQSGMKRVIERVLDSAPDMRSWEVRLGGTSLATELWLREVVFQQQ